MNKINALAFSLSVAIVHGLILLILSIWNSITNFGTKLLDIFSSVHPNVFRKVDGSIFENMDFILVNTVYALIDGFIIGYSIAVLYNFFIKKFSKDT